MYKTEYNVKYKVINTRTNSESKWCKTEYELLNEIKNMFKQEYHFIPSYTTVLMAVKQNRNDDKEWYCAADDCYYMSSKYCLIGTQQKFLMIIDNFNRFIPVYKLNCVKYDYHNRYYILKPVRIHYYNRKKKLKEKDSGYRKEPVSRTGKGRYHGRYGRRIHYKETWIFSEDDKCKEYGIKGYRPRRRVNAWDIEPVEHSSRSWKDKRIKRQWMKNLKK